MPRRIPKRNGFRAWHYSIFGRNALPDKKFIDEVVSDRPVYLPAYDGHSSLANRRLWRQQGSLEKRPIRRTGSSYVIRRRVTRQAS